MTHRHRRTISRLFQHPMPVDLEFHRVEALFLALGADVSETKKDSLKIKMPNGPETFLPIPRGHQITERDDVAQLKAFLESINVTPNHPDYEASSQQVADGPKRRLVVALTHGESSIYEVGKGSDSVATLTPYDPWFHRNHLDHRKENTFEAQRAPEQPTYYKDLFEHVRDADEVLLVGHGEGFADMRTLFVKWVQHHHQAFLPHIVGVLTADHLTDAQMLERAREAFGLEPAPRN